MLHRFKDYIQQQHLFSQGEEVLLAVSGGRDSVCMAHLFQQAAIPFAVAHCNFHLRPGDCDRDQQFVRTLADSMSVPFFTIDFDTRSQAREHDESLEEAARRLRYEWFASICHSQGFHAVATAHHRDDSIETFFLNLFRGTGIAGLHGIRPLSIISIKDFDLRIVHPLLPFSRAEIDTYVKEHSLPYVEDATNSELDARRNQIRHRLIPLLRELYPSVDATMAANIERLHDTELLYRAYIEQLRLQMVKHYPSDLLNLTFKILYIDLPLLQHQFPISNHQFSVLFELLHPYGFNATNVGDILTAKENGKMFYSPTHVAELHRGLLLVAPNTLPSAGRHPKPGDRIRTSSGTRLLSDYLKDKGFSRIERGHLLLNVTPDGFVTFNS
jgi:tRNA(Ile)-lysidine synthase